MKTMPDELPDDERGNAVRLAWLERGRIMGRHDLAMEMGITLDKHGKAVVSAPLIQCPCGDVWALDKADERWCAKCAGKWGGAA